MSEPTNLDRVHHYLAKVITTVNEIDVPQGWRVMVGMDSKVLVIPRLSDTVGVWVRMRYVVSPEPEWIIDAGRTGDADNPIGRFALSWPTLQGLVTDIAAAGSMIDSGTLQLHDFGNTTVEIAGVR